MNKRGEGWNVAAVIAFRSERALVPVIRREMDRRDANMWTSLVTRVVISVSSRVKITYWGRFVSVAALK